MYIFLFLHTTKTSCTYLLAIEPPIAQRLDRLNENSEDSEFDSHLELVIFSKLSGLRIGHFRVPPGLCIKARLKAQPLIWKCFSLY